MPIEVNNLTFVSNHRFKVEANKSNPNGCLYFVVKYWSCSYALRSSILQSSQIVFQPLRRKKTSQAQYKVVVCSLMLNILRNVFVWLKGT